MLTEQQRQTMLQVAFAAAHRAGHHALSQVHRAQASIKDGTTGQELVTQVDQECQDLIVSTLQGAFPLHGFLGEEGQHGMTHLAPQSKPGITWVIDPIDGTNNFAHQVGLFAISIGALYEGRPVVGVIYDPVQDKMYGAAETGPATCNGCVLACGSEPMNSFTSIAIDSHFGESFPAWMGHLMTQCRFRNLGTTALHLALTASGGFVASVQIMPKLWDIAAGVLIAERAGALVSRWDGGPLWPIDLQSYQGGPLPCLVGNPTAHQAVVEELSHR